MPSELFKRLNPPRRYKATARVDPENPSPHAKPLDCFVTDTETGTTVPGSLRETMAEAEALADELEARHAAAVQRAAYHRGEVHRLLARTPRWALNTTWQPDEHNGITVSAEWLHALLIEHEA